MGSEMCIRDRPSSSRQHHARVTYLRCTVSSCFGKHLRSITHRIYSYQVSLGCCCCSASFGTKPRYNHTQQTTAAVQRARYNQHPYRAQQQQATPRACDRYALYRHARCVLSSCFVEPEVRHPSHTSNSLPELCSAAEATCCMYARCCPSMHVAAEPEALFQFRQYYDFCCMS